MGKFADYIRIFFPFSCPLLPSLFGRARQNNDWLRGFVRGSPTSFVNVVAVSQKRRTDFFVRQLLRRPLLW